jgi:hypothetical protein
MGNVEAIRSLSDGLLAVVYDDDVEFYQRGGHRDPLLQFSVNIPGGCSGNVRDVAQLTSGANEYFLLLCDDGASCSNDTNDCDGTGGGPGTGALPCDNGTANCAGVYAYDADPATGLPSSPLSREIAFAEDAQDCTAGGSCPPAFNAGGPVNGDFWVSMSVQSDQLFIADQNQHRILRFDGVAAHLADRLTNNTINGAQHPGADADFVIGQIDPAGTAHSTTFNGSYNGGEPGNDGFQSPRFFDFHGTNLWVQSDDASRVLNFGSASATAVGVLGQADFRHTLDNRMEPGAMSSPEHVAAFDSGSGIRLFVSDPSHDRILVWDDAGNAANGADPDVVLGQDNAIDYQVEGFCSVTTATACLDSGDCPTAEFCVNSQRLCSVNTTTGCNVDSDCPDFGTGEECHIRNGATRFDPRHMAVDASGGLYVADTDNNRVLYLADASDSSKTAAERGTASKVFGATDLDTPGNWDPGALALSSTHLFMAAFGTNSNTVLMFDLTTVTPDASDCVLGNNGEFNNSGDRGAGDEGPDGFDEVDGLAVDSDGRLWVLEDDNNRIMWFDAPGCTTFDDGIADGVVSQLNFEDSGTQNADEGIGSGVSGIVVDADGTIWVSESGRNRVVTYPDPMTPDVDSGLALLGNAIGQDDLNSTGANNDGAGNFGVMGPVGLSAPSSIARAGRFLFVADQGNERVLRFTSNGAPTITGGGTFEVVEGGSMSVTLTIADPDGDALTVTSNGAALSSPYTVTFDGTNIFAGATQAYSIVATDGVLSASTSVVFKVIAAPSPSTPRQSVDNTTGKKVASVDDGCNNAFGAISLPLMVPVLFGLMRRRRRK